MEYVWNILFAGMVLFQPTTGGQPEPMPPARPPAGMPVIKSTPPTSSDRFVLPPEAILAVYEDLKQALNGAPPGSVVLSAEYYRTLLDRIERSEKQAQAGRKDVALNTCRISGRVFRDGSGPALRELADLRIELEFRTSAANVLVPLGLKNLRLTKALLDGKTPVWGFTADGLALALDEPRVYQLTLQFQAPVSRSANESRLLLEGLPQAAITTLDVTVSEKVQTAQVLGSGAVKIASIDGQESRLHSDALGVLSQLDLRWQGGSAPTRASPQIVVQADFQATLEDTTIDTDARVRLEVRQGSVSALRFRIATEVTLLHIESAPGAEPVDWSFEQGSGLVAIRPRKPLPAGAAPLELRLRLQQGYASRPGVAASVGLFELLDVKDKQQTGTMAVWLAGERRFRFTPQGAFRIDPREINSPTGRAPVFACRYWQQPSRVDLQADAAPAVPPTAVVRPQYQLTFGSGSATLIAEFDLTPRGRSNLQEIEVRWPKGVSLDRSALLSGGVESFSDVEGSDGLLRLRLGTRSAGRFRLRLEGVLLPSAAGNTLLVFPSVTQVMVERDGRSESAQLVGERGELRTVCRNASIQFSPGSKGLVSAEGRALELPLRLRETVTFGIEPMAVNTQVAQAAQLDLSWEAERHQVQARAEICITRLQAEILETLEYGFAGPAPVELWLRMPKSPLLLWDAQLTFRRADGVQVTQDAVLMDRAARGTSSVSWADKVLIMPDGVQDRCLVRLHAQHSAAVALPVDHVPFPLPVPGPEDRLDGPVHVGIWTSAGIRVESPSPDTGWSQATRSWKASASVAPQLALSAMDLEKPLWIKLQPVENPRETLLVVDRAGFELSPVASGKSAFRARFRLHPVRSESVVLRLPGAPSALRLESVRLNGSDVPPGALSFSADKADASSTDVAIPLQPHHLQHPVDVDLQLSLLDEAVLAWGAIRRLPCVEVPEASPVHWVRWRVELPQGRLPIQISGDAELEQPWHWLVWLQAPQPTAGLQSFEQWIAPGADTTAERATRPSFSFSQQGSLSSFWLLQVPRSAWLLLCSLAALVIGTTVSSVPGRLRLALLGLAAILLALLAVVSPALGIAVVYGMQPGLLVLLLVLGVLWIQQQRWRRQVVMLPSFARLKASGSSMVRSSSLRHPQAQPSTVDGAPSTPATPPEAGT
jgi:hypothetical protein